jgi:hypothetical protein
VGSSFDADHWYIEAHISIRFCRLRTFTFERMKFSHLEQHVKEGTAFPWFRRGDSESEHEGFIFGTWRKLSPC